MPTVVPIAQATIGADAGFSLADLIAAELRQASDGWYAVLRIRGVEHRLWLKEPLIVGALCIAELPFDEAFDIIRAHSFAFADARYSHGGCQMSDPMAGLPQRFLRTPEAACFLGLSARTLEKHRTYGTGPIYRKIGGRVVYALDDLKAWADRGTRTSTSDPGKGTVFPAKITPCR